VTGPAIAAAMESGLASGGVRVLRAGRLPTPLAHASQGRYGVMLTASHNPPTDNGIKLFRDGSEFDREAERAVEERVAGEEPPAAWDEWTETERVDTLDGYLDAVRAYAEGFGDDLDGLRSRSTAGTGCPRPRRRLSCESWAPRSLHSTGNIDGHFPGRGASRPREPA